MPGGIDGAVRLPQQTLRLVVGFAPGGSTDIVGRIVAQRLGERLGQTVIVDNKAGAGGTIGADATARAAPDGYTLTLATTSTHAIAAGAYSKLPYDPVADFTPISLVAITPYLLVVNPQVKANNLAEFVSLAKGNAPADLAIVGGEVQAVFGSMPALLHNARAGKVRPLAVGTPVRARRPRPMFRPWPNRATPGSTPRCGWASWARPTCPSLSSTGSTPRCARLSRCPR